MQKKFLAQSKKRLPRKREFFIIKNQYKNGLIYIVLYPRRENLTMASHDKSIHESCQTVNRQMSHLLYDKCHMGGYKFRQIRSNLSSGQIEILCYIVTCYYKKVNRINVTSFHYKSITILSIKRLTFANKIGTIRISYPVY
jgi:hypothetical protein